MLLCEVNQYPGLDATLTSIVPFVNREAAQGKQPLLWIEVVSPTMLSCFHLADRQNICQGGCSKCSMSFLFRRQLQLFIRKKAHHPLNKLGKQLIL